EGPSYILQVGADYIVRPGVLVGALAQIDWLEDTSASLDTRVDGRGWMAGPYVSVGLTPNLFFDARATWGRSDNRVQVGQNYTAFFDTERWLASGMLTGHWAYENWRFSPNAEVVVYQERQDALTDVLGNRIGPQSVSLGRVIFGPDVGYQLGQFGGVSVELQFALKGVFDFDRDQLRTTNGFTAGSDEFRGKVEAGVVLGSHGGASLVAIGSYDGIGSDDYQSWGGRLEGRLPLTGR
ncbi:MAG: autotransporter outer membrane beta-barrel domain-containing protein, partial [Hyphomicrobiaceae bacterium]|nr:autotransporter outer membrane beta-barrel domain-containing protein [Hyphomicrobiaceae bacterium]